MTTRMTSHEWMDIWKILRSIDHYELVEAGVIEDDNLGIGWWTRFRDKPHETFVQADAKRQAAIWALVQSRLSGAVVVPDVVGTAEGARR